MPSVLKLEGHFNTAARRHWWRLPALSPAQYRELTNIHGLRYHIQLVPFLEVAGHIAFILKHPEYAPLREYPESNYELCATNPDSYKLLTGMYQDLLDANPGVKYFYDAVARLVASTTPLRSRMSARSVGRMGEVVPATRGSAPSCMTATATRRTAITRKATVNSAPATSIRVRPVSIARRASPSRRTTSSGWLGPRDS